MNIWITRHGQTDFNKKRLMQGRTDAPLNETGIHQAEEMRAKILPELEKVCRMPSGGAEAGVGAAFDAVYTSPLQRAVKTGEIIGGVDRTRIITDDRLLEADFGPYERKPYDAVGLPMALYWGFPELFSAPAGAEPVSSMIERSRSFLMELEQKNYRNVLIACHGGIMRTLCGYLADRKNGLYWRPRPHNCEVRVYRSENGVHQFLRDFRL